MHGEAQRIGVTGWEIRFLWMDRIDGTGLLDRDHRDWSGRGGRRSDGCPD